MSAHLLPRYASGSADLRVGAELSSTQRIPGSLRAELSLPPLDFGGIRGEERKRYFAAIRDALGKEYAPISGIFRRVIARTWRTATSSS